MLKLARCFCQDDGIVLDEKVYGSEMSTVARNRAIAYLLESKGVINGNVEEALDFYVKMCSLSVTAESLAGLGLLLARRSGSIRKAAAEFRYRESREDDHADLRHV